MRTSLLLLGAIVALPFSLAAQDPYRASAVCSRANAEVTRVASLPWQWSPARKGDLPAETYSRYLDLLRSSDCHCAAAESQLPTGDPRTIVRTPEAEQVWELARLNLELPECRVPPDLVLAVDDCPAAEIRTTILTSLQNAMGAITDPRVKPLLQDAVARAACFRQNGRQVYRLGVWRHAYGNPDLLPATPGTGVPPDEPFALHLMGDGLRKLLVELTPTLRETLQDHMLNLATDDARSVRLLMEGDARPGEGTARAQIDVDVRILRFETAMFEIGVSLRDEMRVETGEEHARRLAEDSAATRGDIPSVPTSSLRCVTSTEANRGVDVVRVFAALFVVPTFGPGISGGIDWLTSRTLNEELAGAGIAGAVCGLVNQFPVRNPISGTTVVTVDFTRALADQDGVHLYGALGLDSKAPVAWITRAIRPPVPGAPPIPGFWLTARAIELVNPTYTWLMVSGTQVVDDPSTEVNEAVAACGSFPGGVSICVVPAADVPTWVTVTAMEGTGLSTQGTYFLSEGRTWYCSSRGCAETGM